ncbi:hypothetical protein [Streptomyces sp. CT34]|uniref:hypothetical protein n=1 Tax=Streptomyces sp. CT34 TaxID=1553907 RepID=UPI0012FF0E15|nr:hypothetical protein [Streptomyces sp. CT34]
MISCGIGPAPAATREQPETRTWSSPESAIPKIRENGTTAPKAGISAGAAATAAAGRKAITAFGR